MAKIKMDNAIDRAMKASYRQGVNESFVAMVEWLEKKYLDLDDVRTPEGEAVLSLARAMGTELRPIMEKLKP